jgi:hypothetical protein
VIWDTALYDPDSSVVLTALSFFQDCPIPRALSEEEHSWILSRIRSAASSEAMGWVQTLCTSGLATNAPVVGVIVDRYLHDVRELPLGWSEYRLYGQWLRILQRLPAEPTLSVLRLRRLPEANSRTRAWLDIARGAVGDATVAGRLANIAERDGLPEGVRALALLGYAYAKQEEAIPLLSKYKDGLDPQPTKPLMTHAQRPMWTVAREQLRRLGVEL